MRIVLKSISVALGALAVAIAAGLFIYAQNANRLKPELEALLADQLGKTVKLKGDVSWQLFPPLQLEMHDIEVVDEDQSIEVSRLALTINLAAIWQNTGKWRIDALQITSASIKQDDQHIFLTELKLTDFAIGEPTTLSLHGEYRDGEYRTASSPAAMPFTLAGKLTYSPETTDQPQQLRFDETMLTTPVATATCNLDLRDNPRVPKSLAPASTEDLLPVATLLSYDLIGDCLWHSVIYDDATFHNINTKIKNIGDDLNILVEVAEFFGGSMITEVDVDLGSQPIRWHVLPELTEVDSKRLLKWRNQAIDWTALFAMHSEVSFTGNSLAALYTSITANSKIDGGSGQINVAGLKKQLQAIALLTRKSQSVADWPDVWNYQEMVGNWQTRGQQQTFDFVLDHVAVDGKGTYDYAADRVDMLAHVTVGAPPAGSPYRVNSILQDTPLPFRCHGPTQDIKCRLDESATKRLVAGALRGDDKSGLRRKLEQKIEEKVPEKYRQAAKGLLDILGRALEGK